MKKTVFVLLLVVMLLSLTLTAALAGCPAGEDPYPPGYANSNGNAHVFATPPPGLVVTQGNGGHNWVFP